MVLYLCKRCTFPEHDCAVLFIMRIVSDEMLVKMMETIFAAETKLIPSIDDTQTVHVLLTLIIGNVNILE